MDKQQIITIRTLLIGLLMCFMLLACSPGGDSNSQNSTQLARDSNDSDDESDESDDDDGSSGGGSVGDAENIIAIHNENSPQYNDNCSDCHTNVRNAQSLSPLIPNSHVAMLPFTPGEGDEQCAWCHRSVDLIEANASPMVTAAVLRKRVDVALCSLCHGPTGPARRFYQTSLHTNPPNGEELYELVCAVCHGNLANSEVDGESAEDIIEAIEGNEGGMRPLGAIQPAWIAAIAEALGGDPTLPPSTTPTDGASLYTTNCAACHGDLANSTKAGVSAAQIQAAISSDTGGMGLLGFLTADQITVIAGALSGGGGGTTPPPTGTDGAALYAQYCETCHNPLDNFDQPDSSVQAIQSGINNVNDMNSLSFLTLTQIQAISDALSGGGGGTTPPPTGTDGESLYNQYCSACHGSLGDSEVANESAGEIENAIDENEGDMGSLSFLSDSQIEAIADALSD